MTEIYRFFDLHQGEEFVEITEDSEKYRFRVEQYHIGVRFIKHPCRAISFAAKAWNKVSVKLQQLIGIRRNADLHIGYGSNWVSITEELTSYLLQHEEEILQRYTYTKCADEIYLQSLIASSPFKARLYKHGEHGANLRYIVWEGKSSPRTLDMNDYDGIMHSTALFARKFSERSGTVVERICETIKDVVL